MAKTMVAGELYEGITGQLFKIGCQLRQPNGYPFDPAQLQAHLQAAVEGRFTAATGTFKYDQRNDGWTLLENQPRRISGPIVGVPFLNDGESSTNDEIMIERAVTLDANYGQEDAEWLLEHQNMIPTELLNHSRSFRPRSGASRTAFGACRISTSTATGGTCASSGSPTTSTALLVWFVRASSLFPPSFYKRVWFFKLISFIQPPSILPTSDISSDR